MANIYSQIYIQISITGRPEGATNRTLLRCYKQNAPTEQKINKKSNAKQPERILENKLQNT